jgi:hypothetical protein
MPKTRGFLRTSRQIIYTAVTKMSENRASAGKPCPHSVFVTVRVVSSFASGKSMGRRRGSEDCQVHRQLQVRDKVQVFGLSDFGIRQDLLPRRFRLILIIFTSKRRIRGQA